MGWVRVYECALIIPESFISPPLHSVSLIFDVTLLSLMHPIFKRKMTARRQADGIIPFFLLPDPSVSSVSSLSWQDCAATTQAKTIERGIEEMAISAPPFSPLDPDRQAGLSIFSITFTDLPSNSHLLSTFDFYCPVAIFLHQPSYAQVAQFDDVA